VALAEVRSVPGIVLAIGLAAAVGWSRVYLGVHWSTDVFAGWLVGAAWVSSVLCLSRRATRAPPSAEP
jgi:undecaprenyl-diphosphatase